MVGVAIRQGNRLTAREQMVYRGREAAYAAAASQPADSCTASAKYALIPVVVEMLTQLGRRKHRSTLGAKCKNKIATGTMRSHCRPANYSRR